MNTLMLRLESNPYSLSTYIACHGKKRAYWHLRNLGASRFQALRSIYFAI